MLPAYEWAHGLMFEPGRSAYSAMPFGVGPTVVSVKCRPMANDAHQNRVGHNVIHSQCQHQHELHQVFIGVVGEASAFGQLAPFKRELYS